MVASGRIVVISIGMESTAPSATKRQPRNFSISPANRPTLENFLEKHLNMNPLNYLPSVITHARDWLIRTEEARERVDFYTGELVCARLDGASQGEEAEKC